MTRFSTVKLFAAASAVLALSACAVPFNAQVNRFQAMPVPTGQSFLIKAADPKREGSLEFAQYAGLIRQKLVAQGYQAAAAGSSSNLVVSVDYGVDEGKEKQRVVAGSGFGGYGGFGPFDRFNAGFSPYYGYGGHGYGHRGFIYGFYDPFLFGGGYDQLESYTVYTSGLDLTISGAGGERVFEGKAKAMSTNDNLSLLVPNLIEAMFTGFPGNSGETVKITVAPPPKK
jgi:Domain of unknown function (DUF4136)